METLFDILDKFTILVSFFTFLLVFKNWRNDKKLQENIHLALRYQNKKIYLIQTLRRMHCSRSEIQGLLGAVYRSKATKPYNLPFLAGEEFSKRLKDVQSGNTHELLIEVDDKNEFNVFQQVLEGYTTNQQHNEPSSSLSQ